MIGKIWTWLHAKDWRTWLGHGLQGLLIPAVAVWLGLAFMAGVFAVLIHFVLREVPGIITALKAGNTSKLRDGLFDLWAPAVGIALYALLFI